MTVFAAISKVQSVTKAKTGGKNVTSSFSSPRGIQLTLFSPLDGILLKKKKLILRCIAQLYSFASYMLAEAV